MMTDGHHFFLHLNVLPTDSAYHSPGIFPSCMLMPPRSGV